MSLGRLAPRGLVAGSGWLNNARNRAVQATWLTEFKEIAARLSRGLGPLALRIDHIGSTSVPNLPAKDVIDVQITVAALEEPVRAALTSLGYSSRRGMWRDHQPPNASGPESDWEK